MTRAKQELAEIALKALRAITDMTPMPKREHDMWRLAINRVQQTIADIRSDDEIATLRKPVPRAEDRA